MLIEKYKQVLVCFLLILFSSNIIFSQQEKVELNKWLTNWYLLGPLPLTEGANDLKHMPRFENDFLSLIKTLECFCL